MKFFKAFYESLGNSKEQRFKRLWVLIVTIGLFSMLILNVGYDEHKGGCYFKPLDVDIKLQKGDDK